MTAFPFGGHPRFGQYLEWASNIGCQVNSGIVDDGEGRPVAVTRIVSPDGQRWVIDATDQNEFMVPTTISRLDRRLGLDSPWVKFPPPKDEPVNDPHDSQPN